MAAAFKKENKAHATTANRIAERYGIEVNSGDGVDLQIEDMLIEVETTATLPEAVSRLAKTPGRVFVAVTNKDGIRDALRLTAGTHIGVMDPYGEIIQESRPTLPR